LDENQWRLSCEYSCIEAWLSDLKYPDSAHADFWRIDPNGNFYLLRGMQEDSLDPNKFQDPPGTLFDLTLPVWRLGEFLLRVTELGSTMFDEGFEVVVNCEWSGLKGRALTVLSRKRFLASTHRAEQDVIRTTGQFSQAVLQDMLPETVKSLTAQLFEVFDFFQPPDALYGEELTEMIRGNF
jgi:hypothetical protein